jgi:tetratricopeptide (TPR) repeat protein
VIIIVITGLYQKASTSKNNPPKPTALALKTTAPSPQKTEISKPNVFEQAKTALHNKNFNRAIELFEQAIAQNPTNASTIKMYYSKALRGQADIVFVKNPDTAKILLSKAVEADPQNAEAHFELGRLYTKSKDYTKAIKSYQKAANLSYRPSDAFYNLGFIYASTKDFANAEKMFLHVVDLKPPYLDKVLFNLAVVQQKQGKEQQCIENLKKTMINNPKNQRAQQYLNQLKKYKGVS